MLLSKDRSKVKAKAKEFNKAIISFNISGEMFNDEGDPSFYSPRQLGWLRGGEDNIIVFLELNIYKSF